MFSFHIKQAVGCVNVLFLLSCIVTSVYIISDTNVNYFF